MYWTLELASKLEDAPWPATKDELIDYATRSGAPMEVIENLQELEDEGEVYTKPSAIKQTIKYIRGKHPRLFAANMFFKPVGKLANPMPHFVWRFPK